MNSSYSLTSFSKGEDIRGLIGKNLALHQKPFLKAKAFNKARFMFLPLLYLETGAQSLIGQIKELEAPQKTL